MFRLFVACALVSFAAAGCSDDDGAQSNPNTGSSGTSASDTRDGGAAGTEATTGGRSGGSGSAGRGGAGGARRSGSGGAGASSGTGGSSGSGGAGGAGGAGTGGRGGAAASDDAGVDDEDAGAGECVPLENPLNVGGFAKCSESVCPAQDSVCVQRTFLGELKISEASINLLADCDALSKCVPKTLAEQAGRALLTKCKSLVGAEGRCLSSCVPQVALQSAQLPKDVCTGTDLCAPCFDPRTGEETGACSQGCDKGPTEPPKTFPSCCGDRGLCVPPALAADQAKNLVRDTCDSASLCSPTELTDPTFKPKACASLDNAEGRCLSTCIGGPVAAQRGRLPTAGCGMDEVCAPCFDPITGEDTGACTVNGDKPTQPKYTFETCCDNTQGVDVGVCVSPELAGDQADMLRRDTCLPGKLCAPIAKAKDPTSSFPRCYGAGAGACVPSCILDPTQAALFGRGRCEVGELCAPCSVLGVETGACD